MAQPTIDTPDYQRGVVSAQMLLATVPANTPNFTVTLPPNIETLVIVIGNGGQPGTIACAGVTTTVQYQGMPLAGGTTSSANVVWMFDVSAAIDTQVQLMLGQNVNVPWYVYADAGVHLTADIGTLANQLGVPFNVPMVPAGGTLGHPPVELQSYSNWGVATGTTILPAAGANHRYRIFYAQIQNESATAVAGLSDSISTKNFVLSGAGSANINGVSDFKPTGLALSTNAAVMVGTTAGNATINLVYTVELV